MQVARERENILNPVKMCMTALTFQMFRVRIFVQIMDTVDPTRSSSR